MDTSAWFRLHFAPLVMLTALACGSGQGYPGDLESGFPPATRDFGKSVFVGDPVSAATGGYFWDLPLLPETGPFDLGFRVIYRSEWLRLNGGLPWTFWWYPYCCAVTEVAIGELAYASVYLPDGEMVSFLRDAHGHYQLAGPEVDSGGYVYRDNLPRYKHQLVQTEDYLYLLDATTERVYVFQAYYTSEYTGEVYWRPAWWLDRNGHVLTFNYSWEGDFLPETILDGLGHALVFDYDYSKVISVLDQCGRTVTLQWEAAGADNDNEETLRSVTDVQGNPITFSYAGRVTFKVDLVAGITYPEGNTPSRQAYGPESLYDTPGIRLVSQTDAYDHRTDFAYDNAAGTLTATFPDGTARVFAHFSSHGFPSQLTDETGHATAFTRSESETLTGITDKNGALTSFAAHPPSGQPASVTDAQGRTTTFTYTPMDQPFTNPVNGEAVTFTFYDLARVDYPDLSWESFATDGHGNLAAWTDRSGANWTYQVDAHGRMTAMTTPAGGVFSYTYDPSGRLASQQDSGTGAAAFEYDACDRLVRLTHPDGTFVRITYSLLDLITSITDENGHAYAYAYDDNGNLLSVTDPDGQATRYGYDLMDRIVAVTDRVGQVFAFTYDTRGRLLGTTDPSGVGAAFGYDPHGWLSSLTMGGRTWTTAYNAEGITTARTTPLGHQTTFFSNALGQLTGVLDPLGHALAIGRDANGQYASVTDPLSATTNYTYDGRGLLTAVTLPNGDGADYLYTSQGLLDSITDLNGAAWEFGYTPEGRLASAADPLGRGCAFAYDNRGRLTGLTRPGGETLQLARDGAGNITGISVPGDAATPFVYDACDRLTGTTHLELDRDAEGRVTASRDGSTAFGAGYDPAGRLAAATYANGAFAVNYAYDPQTGLLKTVSDNLTGTTVEFLYDADHRLTGLNLTGGEQVRYTWDAAGRLVRLQSGRCVDLRYAYNAAGRVTGVDGSTPVTVEESLEPGEETRVYDAAGQAGGPGWAYSPMGRATAAPGHVFGWNWASNLTGLDGETLQYNGLDQLRRRVHGAEITHCYYNHAIARLPLVAEADAGTGQFRRFYVWTPTGRLLYLIDAAVGNAVRFYHFDVTGHTLALTDAAGECTDAYAYDPYGRLMARRGDHPQPFTWAGAWGGRRLDEAGTLYLMGCRPYDAVSGRFLSREPLWPQLADPKQLNPYLYAKANPVSWVDPSGQKPELAVKGLAEWWSEQIAQQIAAGGYTESRRQVITPSAFVWRNHTDSFGKGWLLAYGLKTPHCKQCVESVEAGLTGNSVVKDPTANPSRTANNDPATFSDVLHATGQIATGGSTASGLLTETVPHSSVLDYTAKKTKVAHKVWQKTPLKNLKPCTKYNTFRNALKFGKGCTIVAGAVSWYEVGEYFTKTDAEISKQCGENGRSWNPLVRIPHEIGYWIAKWWYGD